MPDIVKFEYARTGRSSATDAMGMRDMQARAYAARKSQYLLLKSPPASGKSRALMFIALDKLYNQRIKKVIVSVPERSIGSSFAKTNLTKQGFFADWDPSDQYNLCTVGADYSKGKVDAFRSFMMDKNERILICTHATLRYATEGIDERKFNNYLIAIDEFHHVSASDSSCLGQRLRGIMEKSNAHIVAMTGSYFRGDSVPILEPEDEAKFEKITYNYYEQLNGYKYLKSLGIGYHFYQGRYTDVINEVLNTDKKTILHIPNVNAGESTKDKWDEVDTILESIGEVQKQDSKTGVIIVKRKDGKRIKVANLVDDDPKNRDCIVNYLRKMKRPDDMDLIIALGMAKEGFDWPFCENALTVGYRGSLTEIIQIIGRCTRDAKGKTHAQFTNLIAQPKAKDDEVVVAVNNMLKAITASLLMEQVLAPEWNFKTRVSKDEEPIPKPGTIKIWGLKEPKSKRVKAILESDIDDLKATILQNEMVQKAIPSGIDPKVINKALIPKIIRTKYPELDDDEVEALRQHIVTDLIMRKTSVEGEGDKRFVRMADKFVNIDDLHIDLIDSVNPFQSAFEVLSKSVTKSVLKSIQDAIESTRIEMTAEEAKIIWPDLQTFIREMEREPSISSSNPKEKRLAECLIYLRNEKRKLDANNS